MLLKCDGTVYDLDVKVKVKFDITNAFFKCGFLLMFKTFYMSNLHKNKMLLGDHAVFKVFSMGAI